MTGSTAFRTALILAWITILYNLLEGVVSVGFGSSDETLALFGFGIDSFVEVLSGIGILHMLHRIRKGRGGEEADRFERTALRVTGTSFFILTAGLVFGSVLTIVFRTKPETTLPGIIISAVSILTMWWLMSAKKKAGRALGSEAILSDAACTKTCLQLSVVLLISSLLYQVFRLPYIDAAGSLVIAWFAFREGREAFEKAKNAVHSCGCGHCDTPEQPGS
jgi:divalent metal cation (Fe/Co/Zn/Cd) transporter